jgi:hypothetical protein
MTMPKAKDEAAIDPALTYSVVLKSVVDMPGGVRLLPRDEHQIVGSYLIEIMKAHADAVDTAKPL